MSGRAVILIQRGQVLRYQIGKARLAIEIERLEKSRERSRQQLVDIRARVALRRPELATMFDAQLLMLDDPMLVSRVADIVREQRVNAEWAVQQVFHEFSSVFDEIADPYLRERKGELVGSRRAAQDESAAGRGHARDLLRDLDESSVIVADELTPRSRRRLTGPRSAVLPPTQAAGRPTPRSWLDRSTCPPSSACTMRARSSRPVSSW